MTPFQKLIGTSTLIIALTLAYYFIVYIPKKNDQSLKNQITITNEMLQARIKCLEGADSNYSMVWDKQCSTLGRKENCSLPQQLSEHIEKQRTDNKNNCFKLYPSN